MRPFLDAPRFPGPLYRLPFRVLLSLWMAPVSLGIARAALDAFVELAGAKPQGFGRSGLLRDSACAQSRFAQALGLLGSSRAYLYDMAQRAWTKAVAGEPLTREEVAEVAVMGRHVALSAVSVTEILYELGGASALWPDSLIQRCFRDAHAITQHVGVSPMVFEMAGRELLDATPAWGTTVALS